MRGGIQCGLHSSLIGAFGLSGSLETSRWEWWDRNLARHGPFGVLVV